MSEPQVVEVAGNESIYACADGTPMVVSLSDKLLRCKKCGKGVDEHEKVLP
jgi:hypothetical protein